MLVSEITAFLENAYDVLNDKFFGGELSKVVITIQSSSRAYGHYTPWDAWNEESTGYREINIGAETLNRKIGNVIATLVHEMVHHYCDMKGIKDTSRNGVYHNKRFKENLWYSIEIQCVLGQCGRSGGHSARRELFRVSIIVT